MDELIQAMSIPELEKFKEQYSDNVSIIKIIDGYIVTKTQELAKAKAKEDFESHLDTNQPPPPPDGIYNIYYAWKDVEVEVDNTSLEPEEVEVVKKQAKIDKDGNIVKPAVMETELRYPKTTETRKQWVVDTNKGFEVPKSGSAKTTISKRAITIKGIEGDSVMSIGNFRSCAEGCRYLKLACAGSLGGSENGRTVLMRNGYVVNDYDGTDFTIAES